MSHIPHHWLLPVRCPLPLHPQCRWAPCQQGFCCSTSETEAEASSAASQPELCRLLLHSTDFPASWGVAAFFPGLHPGFLCLPFSTLHRKPRAPLSSLSWARGSQALPLPFFWHHWPGGRQWRFSSALLCCDWFCKLSHLQQPKTPLSPSPAIASLPQGPSWASALLLSWFPLWGRLHLLLLTQLFFQWRRVTKFWRPAPAHLQPPVCVRRVGKHFYWRAEFNRERWSNCLPLCDLDLMLSNPQTKEQLFLIIYGLSKSETKMDSLKTVFRKSQTFQTWSRPFLPKSSKVNVPIFVHIAFIIQAVVALLSVCPVLADFFCSNVILFFVMSFLCHCYCCILLYTHF